MSKKIVSPKKSPKKKAAPPGPASVGEVKKEAAAPPAPVPAPAPAPVPVPVPVPVPAPAPVPATTADKPKEQEEESNGGVEEVTQSLEDILALGQGLDDEDYKAIRSFTE